MRFSVPPISATWVPLTHKHGQPRAIFFQLTIFKTHPLGGKSLLNIWSALPSEVRRTPPAIVFVVPEKQCKGYKRQAINTEGLDVSKYNPAQWSQFALGPDDKTLWDCAPQDDAPRHEPRHDPRHDPRCCKRRRLRSGRLWRTSGE